MLKPSSESCYHPAPPFLAFLDFLASFLLQLSLLFGGVFAFFSKDFGGYLPEKQGESKKKKKSTRKSKKAGIRGGDQGNETREDSLACNLSSLDRACANSIKTSACRVSLNIPPPNVKNLLPLDDRQITHLICVRLKHLLYDFSRGCFGPSKKENNRKEAQTPPKKSYSKCFRRTQIR